MEVLETGEWPPCPDMAEDKGVAKWLEKQLAEEGRKEDFSRLNGQATLAAESRIKE